MCGRSKHQNNSNSSNSKKRVVVVVLAVVVAVGVRAVRWLCISIRSLFVQQSHAVLYRTHSPTHPHPHTLRHARTHARTHTHKHTLLFYLHFPKRARQAVMFSVSARKTVERESGKKYRLLKISQRVGSAGTR